jgi:hypothetical protein
MLAGQFMLAGLARPDAQCTTTLLMRDYLLERVQPDGFSLLAVLFAEVVA